MKKEELYQGVFIAQGDSINVLIRLVGKSPMLRVIGAIDLNAFYQSGEVKQLDTESIEIQDILMYPEKYQFETPQISDAIQVCDGEEVNRDEDTIDETFIMNSVQKYKQFVRLSNTIDQAKVKMKIWLKREHQFSVSQAGYFIDNKIIPHMKPNI